MSLNCFPPEVRLRPCSQAQLLSVRPRKILLMRNSLASNTGQYYQGRCRGGWLRPCRASSSAPEPSDDQAEKATILATVGSKNIVLTGATKGTGFAMAREFLGAGDRVVICGRSTTRLEAAMEALTSEFGPERVHGMQCDVSDPDSMARLGEFAQHCLGTVDVWINNAGEVTSKKLLADVAPAEIVQVVGTNVVGSLLGSREAIRIMRGQQGGEAAGQQPRYHIFNLGFSTFGAQFSKSAVTHKATKMALTQLNQSLGEELQEEGFTTIAVHNLSPGMVLTDLLLKDSTPTARRFFNTLAEEPETVARELVPRIRAAAGRGGSIDYMSPANAFMRIVRGLPQGNRVRREGEQYHSNGVRQQY